MKHLVVIGDALLDRDLRGQVERLAPDAPVPVVDNIEHQARPGGAALAAVLAAGERRPVTLITGVGDDEAGQELLSLLRQARVSVIDLGLRGPTPEKVRLHGNGQPLARLDYGGGPMPIREWTPAADEAITNAAAVLASDYGRRLLEHPAVRASLERYLSRGGRVVWDPHPRGGPPVAGVTLATPNRTESGVAPEASLNDLTIAGSRLRMQWAAQAVAITLGERGALVIDGSDTPLAVPASTVAAGDPCGAGDRFASTATAVLADGGLPGEAVTAAVTAATSFVARGGAGALQISLEHSVVDLRASGDVGGGHRPGTAAGRAEAPTMESAVALANDIRRAGGTVVATGGCFDLLHAGHVRTLQAARALGDCLIVCLNSDDSVRRLKGPDRPLQSSEDRAAVLLGLGCVDAVAVFDQDTPEEVLARLQPDVWAKGGDYSTVTMPEAGLVSSWGGQAVVLPYLPGRSTTALFQEAARRVNH